MKKTLLLLIVFLMLGLLGCASNNALILYQQGQKAFEDKKYVEAYEFFKQSLKNYQSFNVTEGIAANHVMMGDIQRTLGTYYEALKSYENAFKIYKEINNAEGIASSLTRIGITHQSLKKYDLALDYYNEALKIYRELSIPQYIKTSLNQINEVYRDIDRDKAFKLYQQVPEIFVQLGHSGTINSIAVSPNGKYLLTESRDDKTLKLWEVESGREIRTFYYHPEDVQLLSLAKVLFSPDGNYALSMPNSKTIKVWDIRTGREYKTFKDEKKYFLSAFFSPNGKSIWAIGLITKKWDIETEKENSLHGLSSFEYSPDGKVMVSIKFFKEVVLSKYHNGKSTIIPIDNSDQIQSVKFSPDGRYVLAKILKSQDFKIWDVETAREMRRFKNVSDNDKTVLFTPDGKWMLAATVDGAVKLWDVKTGELFENYKIHSDKINTIVFSPDGDYVLTGSKDKTLKLWELQTGKELKTFRTQEVHFATFLSHGKQILSEGLGGVQLWDIATGRELKRFQGNTSLALSVVFSPDGKRALASGSPKNVIWNLEAGSLERELKRYESASLSIVASNDNKYALFTNNVAHGFHKDEFMNTSHIDNLWNKIVEDGYSVLPIGSKGASIEQLNELLNNPQFCDLSLKKNKHLSLPEYVMKQIGKIKELRKKDISALYSSEQGQIRRLNRTLLEIAYPEICPKMQRVEMVNISTGERTKIFAPDIEGGFIEQVIFSPDNNYALLGIFHAEPKGANKVMSLLEISTGKEIKAFYDDNGGSIAFSPDGKYVVSGGGKSLKKWGIKTGEKVSSFVDSENIRSVSFSPDSRYILGGTSENIIKLWDSQTGEIIRTFTGHNGNVWSISFSHDGRHFLSGSWEQYVKLWDFETGKDIKTFKGHSGKVWSVAFSPDGKYVLSGSEDGTTRLWDIAGKEILKLVIFKDGEWIVITPEGYYNSSLNGHKYLNIRMGNKVYGIDQFYDVFYRPDIVAAKLKGEDINSLITLTIYDAIKNPPPAVEITSMPKDTSQPKVKVCYQAKSTGGGIGEVRVFHNGKLVHSDGFYKDIAKSGSPKQLAALSGKAIYAEMRGIKITAKGEISPIESKSKGEAYEDCKEIDAVPGENEVSITAFNSHNTVQSYMKTVSFNANIKGEEPHLYMLLVGIDRYKDSRINLKYATKDATDIKEKIFKQSATLYKPENIHFEMIIDKDATKGNIINRINAISNKIKPVDSFILFVAGHGVLLQNQYYMLTHDFNDMLDNSALISSNEIVDISKKIKSLSQLFIFDTCHAGGVDYIVSGLYDARMSVLAKKMGLHIYASANSVQEALDGYKGNGLFTYSLLDGLSNNKSADKNNDSKISLIELGEYSKAKTAEISKSIGYVQTPLIINFGKDNPAYQLR